MRASSRALQPEIGATSVSLANAAALAAAHGPVIHLALWYAAVEGLPPDYYVDAVYSDGTQHRFTGLSWGYPGQGPRGLRHFARHYGVPLDPMTVAVLPRDRHYPHALWEWDARAGVRAAPFVGMGATLWDGRQARPVTVLAVDDDMSRITVQRDMARSSDRRTLYLPDPEGSLIVCGLDRRGHYVELGTPDVRLMLGRRARKDLP